ncbi:MULTISPECIES: histidine kinase [Stenotrophomonas]|uniref:sensor histidine kinase n=1 Tax=Stenotrophomonas TaxID=40323 RepID=UPI0007705F44|nr:MULTISPECIES: histidine kinase [Stenotrophomonas]AMJ55662.1 hypothetical protein AXG53_02720 [Stenotrophomonas sp. KCTC 12332]
MSTPQPAELNPLDPLSQAQTIIRIMLAGEALAALLTLSQSARVDLLTYFGLASFTIQWVALASLALLYIARRHLRRSSPTQISVVALMALLCSTWLVTALATVLLKDTWLAPPEGWAIFAAKLSTMALLIGLVALIAFQSHWRLRQLAVRAKQAELEALQARIRPHFLFNTLNTGAALVHQRPQDAERLLLDLADLFRAALAGPRTIPLSEEIALSQRYAEIEGLRFGDRMQIHWHLPAPIPEQRVPTLSIQPLIENAIRHGVEPSPEGGEIQVRMQQLANALNITIENALPPAGAPNLRTGHKVGLESSRARIQAMTGGLGDVTTRVENGRHITTITLPVLPH